MALDINLNIPQIQFMKLKNKPTISKMNEF